MPGADTEPGVILTLKLSLVMLLAVLSVVRTLVVATLQGANAIEAARALFVLRVAYVATSVTLLGVVGLAEVLAHG